MDQFSEWLGEKKADGIRLAVMGMWKSFGNSTWKQAAQAAILFDKFYVMRYLGEALGSARKSEYTWLEGKECYSRYRGHSVVELRESDAERQKSPTDPAWLSTRG